MFPILILLNFFNNYIFIHFKLSKHQHTVSQVHNTKLYKYWAINDGRIMLRIKP